GSHAGGDIVGAGHVKPERLDRSPGLPHPSAGGGGGRFVEIAHDHMGAGLRERVRHRRPESAGGAGDQSNAPAEVEWASCGGDSRSGRRRKFGWLHQPEATPAGWTSSIVKPSGSRI